MRFKCGVLVKKKSVKAMTYNENTKFTIIQLNYNLLGWQI